MPKSSKRQRASRKSFRKNKFMQRMAVARKNGERTFVYRGADGVKNTYVATTFDANGNPFAYTKR